ncbi:MAG: polysaccharide deacetylase family protein [Bacteroidales bacterium]|nr:polysaccharide deacetylase family protein [Bacteroidales bacterium]
MEGFLNNKQIEYILYHLNLSVELNETIRQYFLFNKSNKPQENQFNKIIFNLSSESFNLQKTIRIDQIPILFPLSDNETFYSLENTNLIFHHDILKSCFYLLSGYQEYNNSATDIFGRFPHENSIQNKLSITEKPVVNYYFEIIAEAITLFLNKKSVELKRKKLFGNFGFFLTHDIDNVDFYTFNRFLYKIKELTGFTKSYYSFRINIKHLIKTFFELLKFSKKQNPTWNFNYLRALEKQNGFRSAFYFLEKDKNNNDSDYRFSESRIKKLFRYIINENCEIGLHGTTGSVENEEKFNQTLQNLNTNTPENIFGIRQHRLLYKLPQTTLIHEKTGLKYDTTLCFAEHEGFRNSFCLPFKLYDFENDRMIDVWEIPLNVMDVTLFHYRNLNSQNAMPIIMDLIHEIKKFNGIFTLLWHNDFFDEDRYPGVTDFYKTLLNFIKTEDPENVLGNEIADKCLGN